MTKAPKGGIAKRTKSEPTGHETMKRRTPSDLSLRPSRYEFDPKKAYSPEQLAEMGAISVKWNQLTAAIDFIGSYILFTKTPFWLRMSIDRNITTERKLLFLEECLANAELLDEASKQCITEAFNQFKVYRGYRNAIIHHYIYDHEKGIGSFIDQSSDQFQIMVSLEALRNFYSLICVLQQELQKVDLLFRIETDAQRPFIRDERTGQPKPYPTRQLLEQVIPTLTKEFVVLQKLRKSLPPLPKFPDADLIRKLSEEQARHLDPEETDQNE